MAEPLLPLFETRAAKEAAVAAGIREVLGETSLFQLLLHHPPIARLVAGVVETLVFGSALDARLRELAILRVAWRMRSVYEWTNHYFVGLGAGVSAEDARGVREWRDHAAFGERERAVLALVDEALDRDAIGREALARCLALFGAGPLLELALLPGLYRAVAVVLATFDVPLEPGRPPWAPDGVAPRS